MDADMVESGGCGGAYNVALGQFLSVVERHCELLLEFNFMKIIIIFKY
jgi:hypothetical protein